MFCSFSFVGCKKTPKDPSGPPYQVIEVRVAEHYLEKGYDLFKSVVVKRPEDVTREKLNELLDYYQDLLKEEGKVKVMIFYDADSAAQGISELVLAEIIMINGEVTWRRINKP